MEQLSQELNNLSAAVHAHLENTIVPFWENLMDKEHGGFYGLVNYDLSLDKQAVKGCILNSRILWFFANAYLLDHKEEYLNAANHAYEFMNKYCFDKEFGGIYWSMNYDGTVADSTKHTYNQAFAIYALSSFYDASKNPQALEQAFKLYEIIERKCKDERGYLESFNYRFEKEDNSKLSENGVLASRTMNTLLHVFEAYTELYRVTANSGDVRALQVKSNLGYMLNLIEHKIYNAKLGRQEVFFDDDYNSLIDLYSYGHDIETAWLVDRCLSVLRDNGDDSFDKAIKPIVNTLAENIYKFAYKDHSILNECEKGVDNTTRVWWVQAEGVVGFLNAFANTKDIKFAKAAIDIYQYILDYMVDPRAGSEWYWSVNENHVPDQKAIVEPWKCPYHNGRMCFEVVKRIKKLNS